MLVWASAVEARPTIVFSCWIPPNLPLHHHLTKLYVDAFDAMGYDFKMHYRPNQRALMEASTGITDGDCARTDTFGAESAASPLVRVETQIASTSLEAWSSSPAVTVSGIESLTGHRYRIGYVRGHVAVQALVERYPALRFTPVTSAKHGLKMLSAGRLDLFVGTSVSTRQEIATLQLPEAVHSAGHLMVLRGHPYLNEQHRSMAVPLAEALKKQIPDGGWHFE
ncbi:hypothetical protein [Marinimicrobium locisalis]|uniref:hypothetical protein n=1 Tax=Marinimicrobium locisalis TaxID=546022 RepID=UPI00322201FA